MFSAAGNVCGVFREQFTCLIAVTTIVGDLCTSLKGLSTLVISVTFRTSGQTLTTLLCDVKMLCQNAMRFYMWHYVQAAVQDINNIFCSAVLQAIECLFKDNLQLFSHSEGKYLKY